MPSVTSFSSLPFVPLIAATLAGCRATPPANEPRTIAVAEAPASAPAAPASGEHAAPRSRIVITRDHSDDAVWSVSADGKTKRLPWPEGASFTTGRAGAGSDAPLASPDGKRIAYVRGGARKGPVVVRHVESATSADVEAPPRSELLVTDWSSDGRRLLFSAAPLDGPNGVIANPDGGDLRFFVHDVASSRTDAIAIPKGCEYQAWLPSGELVVTCENGSVLARTRGRVVEPIAKGHSRFSQAHVGENGAVAVIADDGVLLLSAGDYAERRGPRGAFADYQFPKPSPSGRRVAYTHHVRLNAPSRVRVDLEVDGRAVASDVYDFEWLDEATLVVLRSKADPSIVRLM